MINIKQVIKRDGKRQKFSIDKIRAALESCYDNIYKSHTNVNKVIAEIENRLESMEQDTINIEKLQNIIEEVLMDMHEYKVVRNYIQYRAEHAKIRDYVSGKKKFIESYKNSTNTANATVDDNSNVKSKNIGVINAEIHKADNIQVNRGLVINKIRELHPDFDAKQYVRDLESHIIYKHDESSFCVPAPYCCSISMYPFLLHGLKELGGLSAAPKNLDSFCGLYVNLIFAVASQFAGAVATPEVLVFFDYFARKKWGDDYYTRSEGDISKQIHQYFQQIVYSTNQPAGSRGMQSAFVNFSYFDEPFFHGMFDNFVFPDGSRPIWESLNWLQKDFMMWFNAERLKTMITFPVESFALIYKDGKFVDEDNARFVADELARGHSFFIYTSESVDSLSSCCRLRNKIHTHEFSFTNGNIGVEIGSKSVITLNLSRLTQDCCRASGLTQFNEEFKQKFTEHMKPILERVYIYHEAYNELLWDMFNSRLLPVYDAGFISLDKQYLTIGLNGLNQAAEYMGLSCTDNEQYKDFCTFIFSMIKNENVAHKTEHMMFNTEQVPAESLAIKNYNWDKADGYWVPTDTNLYASYVFKPNDKNVSILDKLRLHGRDYIGEYLDGGAAAHINLSRHPDREQCWKLLNHAAVEGCSYWTINVPMSICKDCGHIVNGPVDECGSCHSKHISYITRIIGYLTEVSSWSAGRQEEFKTRVFSDM